MNDTQRSHLNSETQLKDSAESVSEVTGKAIRNRQRKKPWRAVSQYNILRRGGNTRSDKKYFSNNQ
jgi:hypothetical protein